MNNQKRQRIYKTIMLIVVVAIITFVVTTIVNYDGNKKYLISSQKDSDISSQIETALATISEIIDEKYIGEVDEEELIEGALKGMVEAVGDDYTEYYTKEELEDFTASTIGSFVGIGIYMQADYENDVIIVQSPMEDSPAEKAGLQAGDQILKVDGVEYKAEDLSEIATKIKGEEGTEVTLTIKREEETFDVTITRASVHVNYVTSELLEDNIGYIYIQTFDDGCSDDFLNAYNELVNQGAKSLIIDLRYNGGGIVDEALSIADLICDKDDTLLITKDKNENKEITKDKADAVITMPIVLLTNGSSASASEILAAALKDNDKAEIVGEKTYGKGVIQELVYLSNGGAVKITTSEYYTPNEEKINNIGIEPDYSISDISEQENKAIEILKEKMQ